MAIKTRAAVAAEKLIAERAEKEKNSEASKTLAAAKTREKDLDRPVERQEEEAPPVDHSWIEKKLANRPQVRAYDEIVAKRERQEEPKAEEAQKAEEAPKAEDTVPSAQDTVAAAVAEAVEPKKVKQTVDGVEHEVDQAEIDEAGGERAWRKQKAADNRLAKSAEANKKTQEQLAQVMQLLLAQQQKAQPPVPTSEELIKQKLDVIRFGTPEEASAALSEVLSKSQPKQLDQAAIVGQALAAMQRQGAIKDFEQKNPHIMTNPLLLTLARTLEGQEIQKATQAGQPIDWGKLYDTIGVQVSSVAPQRQSQPSATQQTPSTPSSVSEKEARKASITTIPTAAARAALPQEEKEPTSEEARRDWIKDARKARGQA